MTAKRKVQTRQKLIDVAMDLFYLQGYEATSIQQILQKADVGSGSLYYFFNDKKDLLLAVADDYYHKLEEVLFEPLKQISSDPIEQVFALLEGYRKNLIDMNYTYGCPIGNLSLEVGSTIPDVQDRLKDSFNKWIRQVEALYQECSNSFQPAADLHQLAVTTLVIMEGGVMLSKSEQSIESFDAALNQLRIFIDCLRETS